MKPLEIVKNELGFKTVTSFQRGWNLGDELKVDGILGKKTARAAQISYERLGKGDLSHHFNASEFRCKCNGYKGCKRILVHRELLISLELLRLNFMPDGVKIVSGYRCPTHNRKVNGAPSSQHLFGYAADILGKVNYKDLVIKEWFAGYGITKGGKVVHVDRRDLMGKARRKIPQYWVYN